MTTPTDFSKVTTALAPAIAQVRSGRLVASGVLFEDGLHVLTIARLMGRKDRGVITLGGDEVEVSVARVDRRRDLAVLKLDEAREGPEWADADEVSVGQAVVVLGRPDADLEATWGIVRKTSGAWLTPRGGGVHSFIDVDGVLPRGFSGGPLVDPEGRVLGVNTRGLIPGGTTLPAQTVRALVARTVSGAPEGRGYLGVRVQRGRLGTLAEAGGQDHGLVVLGVGDETPAAGAGLILGDVLLSVQGESLSSYPELLIRLADRAAESVELRVLRGGEARNIPVTLGTRSV